MSPKSFANDNLHAAGCQDLLGGPGGFLCSSRTADCFLEKNDIGCPALDGSYATAVNGYHSMSF